MNATTLGRRTYLPGDEGELERLHVLLDHATDRVSRVFLVSAADERIEVPAAVSEALRQLVDGMLSGQAVTIQLQARVLTTQQAADLLGVSRPTFVKLLDQGEIPFERVGTTHRRVALEDVLRYAEQRRQAQYEAIMATSIDDEEDLEDVLADLREARSRVAARRRAPRADSPEI